MTIARGDNVIAGSVNKVDTTAMETYLAQTLAHFTEEEWEEMTLAEQNQYKYVMIYRNS